MDNLIICDMCGARKATVKHIPNTLPIDNTTPRAVEFVQIDCLACGQYEFYAVYPEDDTSKE
jgi:predicted nucleic-acid-binding Zn-ribbon protein